MSLRRSIPVLRSLANATSTPLPRSGRLLLAPASSRGAEGRCVGVGEGGLRGGGLRDGRVLLPVGEAVQGVGVRGFGVIDSVQNKIISRNAAKQETQFREQMEELSLKESFDLDDFAKIIEEPLDKISAKMPWNKNKQELKDMKMQREVLKALTKAQRKKPETIRAGHRQAIADKAACSAEEVNKLLAAFRELKAMHGWLSTRRKRKEKIPTSQEELRVMAGDPNGTMLMNFMRVKKSGSGRPSFGF